MCESQLVYWFMKWSGMKVLFSVGSGEKAVLVEYIVFLQTSSEEISSETLDFINLQSNMVEGTYSDSLRPTITEDLNGKEFRNFNIMDISSQNLKYKLYLLPIKPSVYIFIFDIRFKNISLYTFFKKRNEKEKEHALWVW